MKRFPTIRHYADGFSRLKLNGVEWLGVRIVDQDEAADQIPKLLQTEAAKRFVLYEPALGAVDFTRLRDDEVGAKWNSLASGLDWIIVGGESGPGARPCDVAWIRSAVSQCKAAGVAVFVKQMGAHVIDRNDRIGCDRPDSWPDGTESGESDRYQGAPCRIFLRSRKGSDPSEWPEDLRVREVPT